MGQVEHAHPAPGELALDPPAGEELAGLQVQGVAHVGSVPYDPARVTRKSDVRHPSGVPDRLRRRRPLRPA